MQVKHFRMQKNILFITICVLSQMFLISAYTQDWFGGRGGRGGGRGGGWERNAVPLPPREIFPETAFTFCRIQYDRVRREYSGFGWGTDYPDGDTNIMIRLAELTTIEINRNEEGMPEHVVLRLEDERLANYPYIFMSDVGTIGMHAGEAEALRNYLLKGGFLHVDDFWGDASWDHWANEIGKVLPPEEFPIVDIPLDDPLFHIIFEIKEVPQIPSIFHWRGDRTTTSERGLETAEPHFRGIRDPRGRWMVVMTHNTDLADGWERETEEEEYFREYSVKKAYPLGINIIVYAMTH